MADLSEDDCAAVREDLAEMARALDGVLVVARRLAARLGAQSGDFRKLAEEARSLRLAIDPPADLPRLLEAVALEHGVTPKAIRGPKRDRRILPARRAFVVVARLRGASLRAIGDAINRDHSTVVNLLRRAEDRPRGSPSRSAKEGAHG